MCSLRRQGGAGKVERVCDLQRLRGARMSQPEVLGIYLRTKRVGMRQV